MLKVVGRWKEVIEVAKVNGKDHFTNIVKDNFRLDPEICQWRKGVDLNVFFASEVKEKRK